MITIKQLASDLGVTKQAIYNRITKEPLRTTLEGIDGAMQTSPQGTIFLSEEGAAIVANAYAEKHRQHTEALKQNESMRYNASKDDKVLTALTAQMNGLQQAVQAFQDQLQTMDVKLDILLDFCEAVGAAQNNTKAKERTEAYRKPKKARPSLAERAQKARGLAVAFERPRPLRSDIVLELYGKAAGQ